MLSDRIVKHLSTAPFPQSVDQLTRALSGVASEEIEQACYLLRADRRLGRNGADTAASPYRFYIKRYDV